jgi:hypothetical protein
LRDREKEKEFFYIEIMNPLKTENLLKPEDALPATYKPKKSYQLHHNQDVPLK